MEKVNYSVCRDKVYVGKVVKREKLSLENNDEFFKVINSYINCRYMLFMLKDNMAIDLLYDTPNYPIFDFNNNLGYINGTVVTDVCKLGELLAYFNYNKRLKLEDMLRIRDFFFNEKFVKDNCELFGYKEIMAEDLTFYLNDRKVTDDVILKKFRKDFKKGQKDGVRLFSRMGDGVLSREYWDMFNSLGNNYLDLFVPHKCEGKVKKLVR